MKYFRSIGKYCLLLLMVFLLASCDPIPDGHNDEKFTIIFESNGGNNVESIIDLRDTSIYQPINPNKADFIFAGWYYDSILSQAVTWPIILDKDYSLYAKWEVDLTNKVKLSYYELNDVNILKIIRTYSYNMDEYDKLIITTDNRLLSEVEVFNEVTFKLDKILVEFPLSVYGFPTDEKIVDVISYEPVYLIKTESGEWYGAEIGINATGEFLGLIHEFISIHEFLKLDSNEFIIEIYTTGRLFYCYTNLNRVFVAGRIEISGLEPVIFEEPLDVSSQFELESDEHFISDDIILSQLDRSNLALRTNKRIFIPSFFAKTALQLEEIDLSMFFVSIDELTEDDYDDVILSVNEYSINLLLMNQEKIDSYSTYGVQVDTRTYPLSLNIGEVIKLSTTHFVTNQNRYFNNRELIEFDVEGEINHVLFSHSKYSEDENSAAIFKTSEEKYYFVAPNELDLDERDFYIRDISDIVEGYTYYSGYFIKDNLAYYYDSIQDELILCQAEAFIIQSDFVDINTLISTPTITDDRYRFLGWLNLPEDGIILEDLTLLPNFYVSSLERVDINFFIDDYDYVGDTFKIPTGRTYTAEDLVEIYNKLKREEDELIIDLEYLEIELLKVGKQTVDSLLLDKSVDKITVYLKFKANANITRLYYETPYGNISHKHVYFWQGELIDFDAIETMFDYPIEGYYNHIDYSTVFIGTHYSSTTDIVVKLDYPKSTITLYLSHGKGTRTIEFITGYKPNLNTIWREFGEESIYRIVGFYTDELYQNKIETYELELYNTVYVKVGQIIEVDVNGFAGDKIYTRNLTVLEGYTFSQLIYDIEHNFHHAVGYYYDEDMLDEINPNDIIEIGLENIYVKFEPLNYEMREINIVGIDGAIISYKAYETNREFYAMLAYQDIYINNIGVYSDLELTQLLGYSTDWFSIDDLPETIYIDGSQIAAYRFIDEVNDIDMIIIDEPSKMNFRLYNIIGSLYLIVEYHIYDEADNEVIDIDNLIQTTYETFRIEIILLKYGSIQFNINGEIIDIDGILLNQHHPVNNLLVDRRLHDYCDTKQIKYDDYKLYKDSNFEIFFDGYYHEGEIIYVDLTYDTLVGNIFDVIQSEDFTYFQTSETINNWLTGDYIIDELFPVTYFVEDQMNARFFYMSFLTNGRYYKFYQSNEYYGYSPILGECQIERHFGFPSESTLLATLEEINTNEIVALEYPDGFTTMEEFLDAVYLTPAHNAFILYNTYVYNEVEYHYVDIFIMIGDDYRYWSSIPLVL